MFFKVLIKFQVCSNVDMLLDVNNLENKLEEYQRKIARNIFDCYKCISSLKANYISHSMFAVNNIAQKKLFFSTKKQPQRHFYFST